MLKTKDNLSAVLFEHILKFRFYIVGGRWPLGIFSDHVSRLYESGLVCIPVGDRKAPVQTGWDKYCDISPSADEVERWEKEFSHVDRIGLCMGSSSGLVAFDFDYEFDERRVRLEKTKFGADLKTIEAHILRALPQTPAIKVGKKGWTRFYKWNASLENVTADRNGVRLFDFLAWHKQTVIPPSIHSTVDGKVLTYRWVGPPLADCLADIPEISLDLILEIRRLFGDLKSFDDSSRHGRLFAWLMKMTTIERDVDVLVKLLLERDLDLKRVDSKGSYLNDKKHFSRGTPEENARAWVERVLDWKSAKAERSAVKPFAVSDAEVWNYFFEKSFPILRKDIMSERVMVKRDAGSQWADIVGLEGVLKSYAHAKEMPRSMVAEQVSRFVFERTKLEFLCDFPAWDGVDRIGDFAAAIVSPRFSVSDIAVILRHWGSNIFRRIADSNVQNRCLILKGNQGIGKDTWVRSMFSSFIPYFETATLTGTPKDVYELISRLYILHIEEFDQTKNLDIAFIKSIITQPSVFFRESYGRAPSRKNVAVNFVSTANVDDILRDPTGNRRFIVLPVDRVHWNYPVGHSAQVLAQLQAYAKAGEHATLPGEVERKIKAILDEYTPPDANNLIVEMYRARIELMIRNVAPRQYLHGYEAISMLNDIAKQTAVGLRRVQTVLKVARYSKHGDGGTQYFPWPAPIS